MQHNLLNGEVDRQNTIDSNFITKTLESHVYEITQGRIFGRCLSMAKYGQFYGWPNYPAYSKTDVWPKNLLKTCDLKKTAIFAAGHLKRPAILATFTVFVNPVTGAYSL